MIYDSNQRVMLKHEISDTIRKVVDMFIPMDLLLSVGGVPMQNVPPMPPMPPQDFEDTFEKMLAAHNAAKKEPSDDAIIVVPGNTLDNLDPISDIFGNLAVGANPNGEIAL